jgi:RNA polymerase sigma-70 factor (ECF subfamily)
MMDQLPPGTPQNERPESELLHVQTSDGASAAMSHREYVTQLFTKYRASLQRYLTRLVRPEDAAELVQETYFRLLRHESMVRLEAMARAFLFQTATNLARDHRRRGVVRRSDQHVALDDLEIAQEHQGPEQQLVGEQILAQIERAIADLPADTRTVFLLHRFRDLSYPEIAKLMNLSTRSVARKMADALERLSSVVEATL